MKSKLYLFILLFCVFSCTPITHIEKRKYLKGYYIENKSKTNNESKSIFNRPDSQFSVYSNSAFSNSSVENQNNFIPEIPTDNSIIEKDSVDVQSKIAFKSAPHSSTPKPSLTDNTTISKSVKPNESENNTGKAASTNYLAQILILIGGFLSSLLFVKKFFDTSIARKIAANASKNRIKTIGVITLAKIVLAGLGIYAGKELSDLSISIPTGINYGLGALVLYAALTYPRKNKNILGQSVNFHQRKMRDFVITLCSSLILISGSNKHYNHQKFTPIEKTSIATTLTSKNSTPNSFAYPVNENAKPSIVAKNQPRNEAGLIVLTVLLCIILAAGIAAASCAIACSGMEALAVVVALGGLIGIIALGAFMINRIKNPKAKPEPADNQESNGKSGTAANKEPDDYKKPSVGEIIGIALAFLFCLMIILLR